MLTEGIIIALITAATSIFGTYIINRKANIESDIKRVSNQQRLDDRLDAIENKLDIHNGYAEKLGDIAVALAKMETEITNLKER